MTERLLVVLLIYIGVPLKAACVITFIVYLIGGILIFIAIISIINNATYTKKLTEQNEKILEGIATLIEQQSILIEDNEKKEIENYNNTVYDFTQQ